MVFDGRRESYPQVEYSHILSRGKWPEYAQEDWNAVPLCAEHHRTGKEAVHTSYEWEQYYYRFLPLVIQMEIGYVGISCPNDTNVLY